MWNPKCSTAILWGIAGIIPAFLMGGIGGIFADFVLVAYVCLCLNSDYRNGQ